MWEVSHTYVGKDETDFNLRLNNHRKHVYKADAIPTSRHFAMKGDIFNRDVSFIIIDISVKVP